MSKLYFQFRKCIGLLAEGLLAEEKPQLNLFTIVLNGMPFIKAHYARFKTLQVPWKWVIAEGVTRSVKCTDWCGEVPPEYHHNGLSNDGTTEYVRQLAASDPRVIHLTLPFASGKVALCNAAVKSFRRRGVLMQIDSDEFWTMPQLEAIFNLLKDKPNAAAKFWCRFYLGKDRIITTRHTYGNNDYEWLRAWNFHPYQYFKKHEPPVLYGVEHIIPQSETEALGLVFDHYAYIQESQVRFKEAFYRYPGLVDGWRALQKAEEGAVRDYLPQVKDAARFIRTEDACPFSLE